MIFPGHPCDTENYVSSKRHIIWEKQPPKCGKKIVKKHSKWSATPVQPWRCRAHRQIDM